MNWSCWFLLGSWKSNLGCFRPNCIHLCSHKHIKTRAMQSGISPRLKIWPGDLDLWQSIGFQILLRTKYVPSLIKIHWRMLILECSQGCYGRTDGQTVALLYPFGYTSLFLHFIASLITIYKCFHWWAGCSYTQSAFIGWAVNDC
jgi:hypothetical protein